MCFLPQREQTGIKLASILVIPNIGTPILQISLIEEGLLHHPYVPLSPSDRTSAELRVLINKLEEAEVLANFVLRQSFYYHLHFVNLGYVLYPCFFGISLAHFLSR